MQPLVNPATLQISARGRVVFKLYPIIGNERRSTSTNAIFDAGPMTATTTPTNADQFAAGPVASGHKYLAPEYRVNGANIPLTIAESDIEKVGWIQFSSPSLNDTLYLCYSMDTYINTHSLIQQRQGI